MAKEEKSVFNFFAAVTCMYVLSYAYTSQMESHSIFCPVTVNQIYL